MRVAKCLAVRFDMISVARTFVKKSISHNFSKRNKKHVVFLCRGTCWILFASCVEWMSLSTKKCVVSKSVDSSQDRKQLWSVRLARTKKKSFVTFFVELCCLRRRCSYAEFSVQHSSRKFGFQTRNNVCGSQNVWQFVPLWFPLLFINKQSFWFCVCKRKEFLRMFWSDKWISL